MNGRSGAGGRDGADRAAVAVTAAPGGDVPGRDVGEGRYGWDVCEGSGRR
ncbi:hypothetical protein OG543_06350 [Streptomyces sp. NBC_01178]|nr:hypothetical protein OG543_06350 [Streptomyces sp. NBC_01178]